jgi:Putative Flp pilus-assembly TadE/G-like/von Willebrand factor type A domain
MKIFRRDREQGQILVLFTLVVVVLMGLSALVIDVGVLRRTGQELWNAMDAGSLAGAAELPDNPTAAASAARRFATANFPGVAPASINVTYRCVVGDRDNNGVPDAGDVPAVCNPGPSPSGGWRCGGGICAAICVPGTGIKCNTLVLASAATVNFNFGRAVGVNQGSTQQVVSAACVGPCGASPTGPVDLMMVIDRTSSMSATDILNARDAANSVLTLYDPEKQYIGLGLLGPSSTATSCSGANSPAQGVPAPSITGAVTWTPVGLTGVGAPVNQRYLNTNGTLNTTSTLVKAISCFTQSSTGTIMSTPTTAAKNYLLANGRSNAVKGIIFMTDGEPNGDTCANASAAATAAKTAGIQMFTVGFGIDATFKCPDTSGTWYNKSVTNLLANMATNSIDNGCTTAENADGDNFYCQPKSGDLAAVFGLAAAQLAQGTKLINLP